MFIDTVQYRYVAILICKTVVHNWRTYQIITCGSMLKPTWFIVISVQVFWSRSVLRFSLLHVKHVSYWYALQVNARLFWHSENDAFITGNKMFEREIVVICLAWRRVASYQCVCVCVCQGWPSSGKKDISSLSWEETWEEKEETPFFPEEMEEETRYKGVIFFIAFLAATILHRS